MQRTIALFVATICMGLACGLCPARAQDDSKDSPKQTGKIQPVESYRLDFSFAEVADGKNINTRHYSMDVNRGDTNEIKIGSRVPIVSGANGSNPPEATQYQYLDIGTNIWAQLREHGDESVLAVHSDVSNLDTSNEIERGGGNSRPFLPPVVRQIKISGTTLLVAGKPILIGSMDDPNSKRQFQLEVLVTKLK
ncbi:MAG TPA: hypothetical protein VMU05_21890 [Dongiaceae bacterium]|nr:hypothetical protein [Dongiaceae bacterium]